MNPVEAAIQEHRAVLDDVVALTPHLVEAAELVARRLADGGTLYAFGNGGSAAQSQHLAAELVGRFDSDRPGWPAVSLTADAVVLTAVANDYGLEQAIERQVRTFVGPGDLVVAISVSGRSPDVVAGARAARSVGAAVVALTGAEPCPLHDSADLSIAVPSKVVARVQEVHMLCVHALVAHLDAVHPDGRA